MIVTWRKFYQKDSKPEAVLGRMYLVYYIFMFFNASQQGTDSLHLVY